MESRLFWYPRHLVQIVLLGWLACGILSVLVNGSSVLGWAAWIEWLALVVLFILVFGSIENDSHLNMYFSLALIASGLYGVYGFLQFFGIDVIHWSSLGAGRIYSTLGNPDQLAGQIALVLPLVAIFFVLGIKRLWTLPLFMVLICVLFFTQSKSGLLASFISFLLLVVGVLVFMGRAVLREHRIQVVTLVVVFFAIAFASFMVSPGKTSPSLPTSLFDLKQSSASIRIFIWKGAVRLIAESPLIGRGLGSFQALNPREQAQVWQSGGYERTGIDVHDEAYAHNDYLQMAAEGGLLTLVFFLAFFILIFSNGFSYLKKETLRNRQGVVLALMAGLAGFLTFAFFNFPLKMPSVAATAFAWGAILCRYDGIFASGRVVGLAKGILVHPSLKKALESLGAVVLLALMVFVFQGFLGGVFFKSGLRAIEAHRSQDALPYLDRALNCNPYNISCLFYDALAWEESGNWQEAVKQYKATLALYPYSMGACYNLANLEKRAGRYQEAEEYYLRALAIKPNYTDALNNLGALYYLWGSSLRDPSLKLQAQLYYQKAELQYAKALQYRPDFVEAHFNLGVIYLALDEKAGAEKELKRVLELDPNYDMAKTILNKLKKKKSKK